MIRIVGRRLRPATRDEVLESAAQYLTTELRGTTLDAPHASHEYLRQLLRAYEHEIFGAIFLDNRHRVIEARQLFRGTIDGASVHPREVVKAALALNAAALILYHNHPSGIAEPSQADELITRRLNKALALVDIRILDHVIVAGDATLSFAEKGLL